MIIGDTPMVLSGDYHPDQCWFPFMSGTIIPKSQEISGPLNDISRRQHTGMIRIGEAHRSPYVYTEGVPQTVLPFEEFRRVSGKQWIKLLAEKCPGWSLNGGVLLLLPKKESISKWCSENCAGRFRIQKTGVIFEQDSDYIMAKLRFG